MSLWYPLSIGGRTIIKEVIIVPDEAIKVIRFPFGLTDTYSTNQIESGNRILSCSIEIVQAYDGGVQISAGHSVNPSLLQTINDNDPQTLGTYDVETDIDWDKKRTVKISILGISIIGSGICTVKYAKPKI